MIIDVAVPYDRNIVRVENRKVERYQDLALKVCKIYDADITLVPLVIAALDAVTKDFDNFQKYLGVPDIVGSTQMSALLEKAYILRKALPLKCG